VNEGPASFILSEDGDAWIYRCAGSDSTWFDDSGAPIAPPDGKTSFAPYALANDGTILLDEIGSVELLLPGATATSPVTEIGFRPLHAARTLVDGFLVVSDDGDFNGGSYPANYQLWHVNLDATAELLGSYGDLDDVGFPHDPDDPLNFVSAVFSGGPHIDDEQNLIAFIGDGNGGGDGQGITRIALGGEATLLFTNYDDVDLKTNFTLISSR
jgi:hypothetical protein